MGLKVKFIFHKGKNLFLPPFFLFFYMCLYAYNDTQKPCQTKNNIHAKLLFIFVVIIYSLLFFMSLKIKHLGKSKARAKKCLNRCKSLVQSTLPYFQKFSGLPIGGSDGGCYSANSKRNQSKTIKASHSKGPPPPPYLQKTTKKHKNPLNLIQKKRSPYLLIGKKIIVVLL